jgi:hypothetical protein
MCMALAIATCIAYNNSWSYVAKQDLFSYVAEQRNFQVFYQPLL